MFIYNWFIIKQARRSVRCLTQPATFVITSLMTGNEHFANCTVDNHWLILFIGDHLMLHVKFLVTQQCIATHTLKMMLP